MLNYTRAFQGEKGWIVAETNFNMEHLGKTEAIFALGNGYMGVRSSSEESYVTSKRGHFIAGTFNRFHEEVCELPNSADVTRMDIYIDGERLFLTKDNHYDYEKSLNLQTVELTRCYTYMTSDKKNILLKFRRFVSYDDLHLLACKLEIESDSDIQLTIETFVDGQVTNSGAQHFVEKEKRIYEKSIIEYNQQTTQSEIAFIICATHKLAGVSNVTPQMKIDRRSVSLKYDFLLKANKKISLEKFVLVHTSRDKEYEAYAGWESYQAYVREKISLLQANSYADLFNLHKQKVQEKIWGIFQLELESEASEDLLALRFAHYHLFAMMPAHDSRIGIAAKGLSGEGYKGHSFWDTEIFISPFFTFVQPELARNLLEYRYLGLAGARKKAQENNYCGAMYPWEAAWPTDGEVTPVWGAVDVVTGKQTKIWSGFIEQHISADIVYAVWQYYCATSDQAFMEKYGYEIIFDVANFWASRLEWQAETEAYHINNVIGPDEYKEHVNNNAFTNYFAHFALTLAIKLYEELTKNEPALLEASREKINLAQAVVDWRAKAAKLFLPKPNEQGVIQQDDTYLEKQILDLTPYKLAGQVGTLFHKYSLDQVNQMQITKQADVVLLMYLLADQFPAAIRKANYEYYEPKTTHDSSLSFSTHAIVANDVGDRELAYVLFKRACQIDLGQEMKSSDHGIHAASLGGIWQIALFGFGGVRLRNNGLHIAPKLPEAWKRFKYTLAYLNCKIRLVCEQRKVKLTNLGAEAIVIYVYDEPIEIASKETIEREKS